MEARTSRLTRLDGALGAVEEAGAYAAATAILAVMTVVFADVVLRYGFNAPLPWAHDLIGIYLIPALFFLVASATFRRNGHIAVDIAYVRFPPAVQRATRLVTAILAAPVFAAMVALAFADAASRWRNNEVIAGYVLWPMWIPSALVCLGLGALVLRLTLDAISLAAALLHRSADVPGESPRRQKTPAPGEAEG